MNYEMKSAVLNSTTYVTANDVSEPTTTKAPGVGVGSGAAAAAGGAVRKRTPKPKNVVVEKTEMDREKLNMLLDPNTDEIQKIVDMESELLRQKFDNIDENILLDHLGDYEEEPYHIIESYFEGKYLERLVRHQLESYNHFVNFQIQRTIQMFNPVKIRSENDFVIDKDKYFLEVMISFTNFKLYPPQIHENNGATRTMLPCEAKLRNFTYASAMTIDLNIQYVIRNTENMENPKIIEKILPKINIGKLPIMLK